MVDPETINAYEIGLKSRFLDGKLTFNAAAFLTDIADCQTTVSEAVAPGTTVSIQYLTNIPKVRSRGIEADLSWSPTSRITLSASGAYTDAKFVSFTNSPQRSEMAIPGTLQVQDLSGRRLPGVSKFAYTLAADVTQPLSPDLEAYARADWLHRSSFSASATNSIYGIIPAYGLLNGRIGLRTLDGQLDLSIWARNLLNERYYANRAAGTFGLITALPGDPRTVGATLRVKW